ncbi:hypothetical protein [Microbacterium sp. W4I20]|uniref:hypothetical protein n=1 Tax=Microbacterium sp. W4I20 TaxID=3042262 RepID=UPI00278A4A00|nr:hypothetical protein [Microbacterium sp. W4I20]MDQ0726792.1 hypothetical protein [Microbacterium sp. W4I20]
MVDRLVAVNDSDYRLPEPVIQALGTDMSDSGTTIGAILADAYVPSSEVTITQVGSGWNFKAGHPDNVIAPDVLGSIIGGDGTPGRENVIGKGVIANVNTGLSNVPANTG